ncbi:MAG: 4-hydroxy-3-methylbut-2-enyl diphosphate reductase [Clostridium sp.]|jgi:4-hydroxy-3-methylbut-2-enyl diphosphate reductase|nr:4-hydroxy-3-methylbut-2-enyl diphosphate reductase [Clostridium sp.]
MEIRLAKGSGFCFGVKRAMGQVYEQIETGKTIYTYGSLIHNEEVIKELEGKGVRILRSREELLRLSSGVVVIRSHGVAQEVYDILRRRNLEYVDATCPFVKKIHRIVKQARKEGKHMIIIGNPCHPEVEGIVGWCGDCVDVLETPEEARRYQPPEGKAVCIVAQTTFNYKKFQHIVEIFEKKGYNESAVDTICNATQERQAEARKIAAQADLMIVIGGKNSSNTKKLYEICSRECTRTYFIQTLDDLRLELPKAVRLVGITAGASTPNKLIEEVQNYVRINF